MDLRLELVSVAVADVDRAKAFDVDQVGFDVEQDVQVDKNHRFRDRDVEVSEIQDYPWAVSASSPTPMATVDQSMVRCIRSRSDE